MRLVNGSVQVVQNPPADTITIIDLKPATPKVLAELAVPASVVGPPLSVAIAPDEKLALVTAAMKVDPADPTKQAVDNRLTVIDLEASPPAVIARLEAGRSPAGLSINRQGTLALVANRSEGTVSVYSISGKTVTSIGKVTIADDKSGVSHVAFTPDGATALVTRDGDHKISVLSIKGTTVEYTKRDIHAGLRPYGMDISSRGTVAVVANIGIGGGDSDTISVIDLRARAFSGKIESGDSHWGRNVIQASHWGGGQDEWRSRIRTICALGWWRRSKRGRPERRLRSDMM